ncbi:MAG TPA: hypothetical protein VII28_09135, partial [Puia sp.]
MKAFTIFIIETLMIVFFVIIAKAQIPSNYKGKPFSDDTLGFKGPQVIPGRVELAYYDFGGEGVAYHDSTTTNDGAKLNHEVHDYGSHWRPGIPYHIAFFRENEGVDISYTKDWADYKKPNVVEPMVNQLYIGQTADIWHFNINKNNVRMKSVYQFGRLQRMRTGGNH